MSISIWQALAILLVAPCVYHVYSLKVVQRNEENSSPSHINTTKGSSVWLHWNYTYVGDGRYGIVTINYREQTIGFNSSSNSSIKTLAKRNGQNGALTLEEPIPVPFNGRVEMISSNSTLVIHNLQYNDSNYQFTSKIEVDAIVGAVHKQNTFKLKPAVCVSVHGVPEFIKFPPDILDVNESSDLNLKIEVDGHPKPSADFKWPHLTGSSPTNVPSVQLYPFVYSSTYALKNIDASYCGRILETTIKNSIGSSVIRMTNVTVLLRLENPIHITVRKLLKPGCLELKWKKVQAGACYVRYDVVWKSVLGGAMFNKSGYNIGKIEICSENPSKEIVRAQLIISFKTTVKHFGIKISGKLMPTAPSLKDAESSTKNANSLVPSSSVNTGNQTSNSTNVTDPNDSNIDVIVGLVAGAVVTLGIVIFMVLWCMRNYKCNCHLSVSKRNGKRPCVIELQRGSSIVEPLPSEPSSPSVMGTEGFEGYTEEPLSECNFNNGINGEENRIQLFFTDGFRISQEQKEETQEGWHGIDALQHHEEVEIQEQTRVDYAAYGAVPEFHFDGNGVRGITDTEKKTETVDILQHHEGGSCHVAETQF